MLKRLDIYMQMLLHIGAGTICFYKKFQKNKQISKKVLSILRFCDII